MKGTVVWFTGRPSSGKTTLARAVKRKLDAEGTPSVLLDSDELRAAVFPDLGYSPADRRRFYRALAGLAAVMAREGLTVLVAATANQRRFRTAARAAAPRFVEVFVDTPAEECARRDAKGLYRRGVKLGAYERPSKPEVVARGGSSRTAVAACIAALH